MKGSHVCIENSMRQNCPVCWEYLFDSIKPINILPCGHTIHQVSTRHQLAACCHCLVLKAKYVDLLKCSLCRWHANKSQAT